MTELKARLLYRKAKSKESIEEGDTLHNIVIRLAKDNISEDNVWRIVRSILMARKIDEANNFRSGGVR